MKLFEGAHHQNIDTLYKYGKWCGEDYGGFDNSCKDLCLRKPKFIF